MKFSKCPGQLFGRKLANVYKQAFQSGWGYERQLNYTNINDFPKYWVEF
jgi:hypothetical protein